MIITNKIIGALSFPSQKYTADQLYTQSIDEEKTLTNYKFLKISKHFDKGFTKDIFYNVTHRWSVHSFRLQRLYTHWPAQTLLYDGSKLHRQTFLQQINLPLYKKGQCFQMQIQYVMTDMKV